MKRRNFIKSGTALAALSALGCSTSGTKTENNINLKDMPKYLQGFEDIYRENPRQANLEWFKQAKFGLFMHYGLYSLIGRGEWVQLTEKIPVSDYGKLQDDFTASKFDPDFITDLALEAEMKYINITSRHHDSFCLFETRQTNFNSLQAPAQKDLIAGLHEQCQQKGLGLFLYYSYALDWKHPYFYSDEASMEGPVKWNAARPDYEQIQPEYKYQNEGDFLRYITFVHKQLEEILTQYPYLAGIWLDPIMGYYTRPDLFPIEETYALIRELQPQALIAFKQGANGDEDFVAPERTPRAHPNGGEVGQMAWEKNKDKPKEICDTLQPKDVPGNSWGYNLYAEGKHIKPYQVMEMLDQAQQVDANLLLNTGPLPDGSIHEDDQATLKEVGKRLRQRNI
ncbi:MAG: alpha-L-fucosidase [Candidatus Cyclobacteriaceae bacterium M3_2C_046]